MAELMAAADLAFGAGGSTAWERCCLGLPAMVITVADNQVETTRALGELSFHYYLGHFSELSEANIASALAARIAAPEEAYAVGAKGLELVDGLGAERVAAKLRSLQ